MVGFFKLLLALSLWVLPSTMLGLGLWYLFDISWIGIALTGIAAQWFYSYWAKHHREYNRIEKSLERYDSLEYKQYLVPLTCQECGKENEVELDLTIIE